MEAPVPDRDELLAALRESQERIAALEARLDEADWLDDCLRRRTRELGERVKELECLHEVSALLDRPGSPSPETLAALASALPRAFQRPGEAAARVVVRGRAFQTPGFDPAGPTLSAESPDGLARIEVAYRAGAPAVPFLKEESRLLGTVAARLGASVASPGEML